MSLRARLLAGMVALVAAGLTVTALVTYEEQRTFLLDRVDQQVFSALGPLSTQLRFHLRPAGLHYGGVRRGLRGFGLGALRPPGAPPRATVLPPGTFGELRGPGGAILQRRTFSYGERTAPAPALAGRLPLSAPGRPPRLFTVNAADGSQYRAVAFGSGVDTAIVAVPTREAYQTLHRLVLVELLVGGGVILALVALGWLVIRVGLLPLERIGRVATEIAGGDLSRRVSSTDPRTEVGRLGRSLNEMLTQIEQAFSDRQQSEDRLRRFLADASHELRTPLASIRGYAELFRLGAADEPATLARAMARIEAEATRMGVLVSDLLLLAQLDHIPEPRRIEIDLCELAQHAAQDTHVVAPEREIKLRCSGPVPIRGDPDQLRQLLANLIGNAVIYTPPESPIELDLNRADDQAILEVRDHGPGLPPDGLQRVFERFWRDNDGRSPGRGGAGLGLAIVEAIVRAHGGCAEAENAAGGGARFRVTLPLR